MRRLSDFFTVSLLVGSLIVSSPAMAKKKAKVYKIKAGSSLRIYENPTVHSIVVTKLPSGSRWILRLRGTKTYSSSTWFKISWNGREGWVNRKRIVFDSHATQVAKNKPSCLLSRTHSKDCNVSS